MPYAKQNTLRVCVLRYVSAGRTSFTNTFAVIPLNTFEGDTATAPVISNQFTLQPGVYAIDFNAVIFGSTTSGTDTARVYLYNVTDATEIAASPVCEVPATSTGFNTSNNPGAASFTISTAKTYELRAIRSSANGGVHIGDSNGSPWDKHAFVKISLIRGI